LFYGHLVKRERERERERKNVTTEKPSTFEYRLFKSLIIIDIKDIGITSSNTDKMGKKVEKKGRRSNNVDNLLKHRAHPTQNQKQNHH